MAPQDRNYPCGLATPITARGRELDVPWPPRSSSAGAREVSTIVAVGNCGRGPVGPCGRDRQVLFDYHPKIRVILPTPDGIRSVKITDLMPLGAAWTPDEEPRTSIQLSLTHLMVNN